MVATVEKILMSLNHVYVLENGLENTVNYRQDALMSVESVMRAPQSMNACKIPAIYKYF